MADNTLLAPSISHRYTGVEQDEIANWKVNHTDVCSFKYLVMLLHEWLVEEGYASRSDKDFPETIYVERVSTFGREIFIRWRCVKKTGDSLFNYAFDIEFHTVGLKEVEIMHKGQKFKADKGEVEVALVANLLIDPERTWENHWLLKYFKKTMLGPKGLLITKRKLHQKLLEGEANRFQDAIKTYLKLDTYLPERENKEFWAKKTPE